MKTKLYTIKGEVKGDINLPKEYDLKPSNSLLLQAIRVFEDRTHFGLARVKTRSEVNKTRKKLYKQKGTGGARHGAKSAHIFVGGGVAHGPKGEKRDLNLPLKMKKKALYLSLVKKFNLKTAILVEGLNKVSKTSEANKMIKTLKDNLKIKSKVVVVFSKENCKSAKYFKNIKNVIVNDFSSLNAFNVLTSNMILIDSFVFDKSKKEKKKIK